LEPHVVGFFFMATEAGGEHHIFAFVVFLLGAAAAQAVAAEALLFCRLSQLPTMIIGSGGSLI